jgi:hypothetical protein
MSIHSPALGALGAEVTVQEMLAVIGKHRS